MNGQDVSISWGGGASVEEANRTQPGEQEFVAGVCKARVDEHMSAIRKCWECGTLESPFLKLRTCQQCRLALYCSKDCQRAAWKGGHKAECKQHVDEFYVFYA
jgi:hypothetical protein